MSLLLLAAGVAVAVVTTPGGLDKRLNRATAANSWQKRLDKAVFDIDISLEQRVRLLQRVAEDGKQVTSDLKVAAVEIREKGMGKGHPLVLDLLFPAGTTARSDLEGLVALRKQVPELLTDISEKLPNPTELQQQMQGTAPPPDPTTTLAALATLATDQSKRAEIVAEAKNALRRTPKGLETPRYTTLRSWAAGGALDGEVELRSYDPYTVARTATAAGALDGGAGFTSLAGYLFGDNEKSEAMAMTMPVEMETGASGATAMAFVLPRTNAAAPPVPNAADVAVEQVAAKLVAVKAFAGIVTDQEVERQLQVLRAAVEADGGTRAVGVGYSVLQYNAPYTVPWRRRNELAIVVELIGDGEVGDAAEALDDAGAGVVSWYDSGVRLRALDDAGEGVVSWYDSGVRLQ